MADFGVGSGEATALTGDLETLALFTAGFLAGVEFFTGDFNSSGDLFLPCFGVCFALPASESVVFRFAPFCWY